MNKGLLRFKVTRYLCSNIRPLSLNNRIIQGNAQGGLFFIDFSTMSTW